MNALTMLNLNDALIRSAVSAASALLLAALLAMPAAAQFVEPATTVPATLPGEFAGDRFGWISQDLGDLSGDGCIDYVFTAAADAGSRGTVYGVAGIVPQFSRTDIDLDINVAGNDLVFFTDVLLGTSGNATHMERDDVDHNGVRTERPRLIRRPHGRRSPASHKWSIFA